MFAAVLDRTRAFFDIPGGFSVFSALISGRDLDARNEAMARISNQQVRKRPSRRLTLIASAVIAPAALGLGFEPGKSTLSHLALAEHGQPAMPHCMGRELGNRVIVNEEIRDDERFVVDPRGNFVHGLRFQAGQGLVHRHIAHG